MSLSIRGYLVSCCELNGLPNLISYLQPQMDCPPQSISWETQSGILSCLAFQSLALPDQKNVEIAQLQHPRTNTTTNHNIHLAIPTSQIKPRNRLGLESWEASCWSCARKERLAVPFLHSVCEEWKGGSCLTLVQADCNRFDHVHL